MRERESERERVRERETDRQTEREREKQRKRERERERERDGLGNLRKDSRSSKISLRIFKLFDLDISDLASHKITHYLLITKSNQFYTVLYFGFWEIHTSLEN